MSRLKEIFGKKKNTEQEPLTKKQRIFREFRDYLCIFGGFMLVFALLFRVVQVDGGSMNQTLYHGDRLLLVSRVLYHEPEQGDIIVASKESFRNGKRIIKRVIATEGQTVDIDFENRIVYVDGAALDEPYVYFPDETSPMNQEGVGFPLEVPEGCVFVMGDNRNNSLDSRSNEIGLIDCREILGKVVFLIFPGTGTDLGRIGVIG